MSTGRLLAEASEDGCDADVFEEEDADPADDLRSHPRFLPGIGAGDSAE